MVSKQTGLTLGPSLKGLTSVRSAALYVNWLLGKLKESWSGIGNSCSSKEYIRCDRVDFCKIVHSVAMIAVQFKVSCIGSLHDCEINVFI